MAFGIMTRFWNDQDGFVVSAELVLVATLLVIGLLVGMSEVQTAITHEFNDVAESVGSLNQSYSTIGFSSVKGTRSGGATAVQTFGSRFSDGLDTCDGHGIAGELPDLERGIFITR